MRKWVRLFGTNNTDHQARICHSTTVAGVANTWGYGAMTNSYNDMQNAKAILYIGCNAAEAHPVSMLHMLHAKESGLQDDRRRSALHPHRGQGRRLRAHPLGHRHPVPVSACCYHIFKNGWEDKQYIDDRVYGMDKVREEVHDQWTPGQGAGGQRRAEEALLQDAPKTMAKNRPSTIVWCMGQTQHTIGNAMVRASCILQLALGNVGKIGRRHQHLPRPRQRAGRDRRRARTPIRCLATTASVPGAWQHWAQGLGRGLRVAQEAVRAPAMMTKPGMTVSRWIDGVMEKNELIDQDSNLRGAVLLGPRAQQPDARPGNERRRWRSSTCWW